MSYLNYAYDVKENSSGPTGHLGCKNPSQLERLLLKCILHKLKHEINVTSLCLALRVNLYNSAFPYKKLAHRNTPHKMATG